MARKIILFLSDYKAPRENTLNRIYHCPNSSIVKGTQTNDAPVKYLLQGCPDLKGTEILCIVTPVARDGALEPFRQMVKESFPGVTVTDIPFDEGQEDFSESTLPKIMSAVTPGDEILLETTGGYRNAVMHLLLISRALTYSGIPVKMAVYSNPRFGEDSGCVEDISHLIRLFDLIGGMQEMASFGSVGTLREYYRMQGNADPAAEKLLAAMEALQEDITLCRTRQLGARMDAFNDALEQAEACSDPLMRALLPAFQKKFDKHLSVPGLIKWCVGSNMLQQALTIYKEQIPAHIMNSPHFLQLREHAPEPKIKDYQTVEEARFHSQLLEMGAKLYGARRRSDPSWEGDKWKNPLIVTVERLEEALPYSYFHAVCPVSQLRDILMDYLYLRALRNTINHANEQGSQEERSLVEYLSDANPMRYKKLDKIRAEDIRQALLNGLEHLQPQPRKGRKR